MLRIKELLIIQIYGLQSQLFWQDTSSEML